MNVYCVKGRRLTPSVVKGTEKIVWTSNNRKCSKSSALCAESTKLVLCRETDGALSRRGLWNHEQRRRHRARAVYLKRYSLSRKQGRRGWQILCFWGNEGSGVAEESSKPWHEKSSAYDWKRWARVAWPAFNKSAAKLSKTDRADLDGAGFDIHSAIGKRLAPKKGWTSPGHNYTGPYNPLEQHLKYNPETGDETLISINSLPALYYWRSIYATWRWLQ